MQYSGISLPFVFVCLLYDLLSFLFHCRLCIWTQHYLGWEIFCLCFSISETYVSERQISRVFWTIRNSIPEVRWSEPHSEFILLSSQIHTEEYLVLPGFWRLTRRILSHKVRCVARRDNMCLLSTSKEIRWRTALGSFHRNEFVRKVVIPSCPAISIQLNLFSPQMFWLFANPVTASYFSSSTI